MRSSGGTGTDTPMAIVARSSNLAKKPVCPYPWAVATPRASIVATRVSTTDQTACDVTSRVLPSLSVTTARSCNVCPRRNVSGFGLTEICD